MTSRKLLTSLSILAFAGLLGAVAAKAGVIINEIDYDQPSTDTAEWLELYNPDPVAQSLVGLDLVLVNGATAACTPYNTFALDTIVIPANGYVVIGNIACADPTVSIPASNAIQNGAPDGMFIQDRNSGAIVDSVEYEQPGASVCSLTPTPATDNSVDTTGSIQLCGGGWVYDPVYTPCAPNNCPPVSVDESTWGRVKGNYR